MVTTKRYCNLKSVSGLEIALLFLEIEKAEIVLKFFSEICCSLPVDDLSSLGGISTSQSWHHYILYLIGTLALIWFQVAVMKYHMTPENCFEQARVFCHQSYAIIWIRIEEISSLWRQLVGPLTSPYVFRLRVALSLGNFNNGNLDYVEVKSSGGGEGSLLPQSSIFNEWRYSFLFAGNWGYNDMM